MSISLGLLPLAVSAGAAAHTAAASGTDAHGRVVCHVGTRMRDTDLLVGALADARAEVEVQDPDHLVATWQGVTARFSRDGEGTWSAHLTGEVDEGQARSIVTAIDAAYGRRVQAAVLARLRERAPSAGLRIESEERHDDDSVQLVLTTPAS